MFQVSMLRKFLGDLNSIILLEDVSIEDRLTYEEVRIEILDWQVKTLRNKEVASVKILCRN